MQLTEQKHKYSPNNLKSILNYQNQDICYLDENTIGALNPLVQAAIYRAPRPRLQIPLGSLATY